MWQEDTGSVEIYGILVQKFIFGGLMSFKIETLTSEY